MKRRSKIHHDRRRFDSALAVPFLVIVPEGEDTPVVDRVLDYGGFIREGRLVVGGKVNDHNIFGGIRNPGG